MPLKNIVMNSETEIAPKRNHKKRAAQSNTPQFDAMEVCHELYDAIRNARTEDGRIMCEPFIRTPKRRTDPEYYESIKVPIDMLRIQYKLRSDEYTEIEQLTSDVELIVKNAHTYYQPDSAEYSDATSLLALYNKTKEEILSEMAADDTDSRQGNQLSAADKQDLLSTTSENSEESVSTETSAVSAEVITVKKKLGRPPKDRSAASQARETNSSDLENIPTLICNIKKPILYDNEGVQDTKTNSLETEKRQSRVPKDRSENTSSPKVMNQENEPKKPGRPPKDKPVDSPQTGSLKITIETEKRPGRPVKDRSSEQQQLQSGNIVKTSADIEKRPGRPPKDRNAESDLTPCKNPALETDVKRPGRPPKDRSAEQKMMAEVDEDNINPSLESFFAAVVNARAGDRHLCEMFKLLPSREFKVYYDIIKNPIDLKLIAEKIQAGNYKTIDELYKDFQMMVANAKAFNEPGSQIYKDAVALRKIIHSKKIELDTSRQQRRMAARIAAAAAAGATATSNTPTPSTGVANSSSGAPSPSDGYRTRRSGGSAPAEPLSSVFASLEYVESGDEMMELVDGTTGGDGSVGAALMEWEDDDASGAGLGGGGAGGSDAYGVGR